jgi:hypothetical protein
MTPSEVQGGILVIRGDCLPKLEFGFVEVLVAGLGRSLQQGFGNGIAHSRGLHISRVQNAHQVFSSSRRLHLVKLAVGRQGGQPTLLDDPGEACA